MATKISVGLCNDGTVRADILELDEDGDADGDWNCNMLTLEEAAFLSEELASAVERGKKRRPSTPGVLT